MKSKKSNQVKPVEPSNINKSVRYFLWTLFGLLFLVGITYAGTTISNFTIQGPYIGATVNNFIVFNTAAFSGPDLYSITALPASVDTLNIASQSFVQADLDLLAGLFLGAGTLPKSLWDSSTQTTTDQPSLSVQADLTADVTSVTF
jgi:hypothetical protein